MAVGDRYSATFVLDTPSIRGVNVLHYRVSAETGAGCTPQEISDALDGDLWSQYKAWITPAVTYRGVITSRYWPAPPSATVRTTVNAGPGIFAGGDQMPTQVAGLISWRTALAGVKYRGRMYMPFPDESLNGPTGTPTAAAITLLTALADDIIAAPVVIGAAGTATLVFGLQSRKVPAVFTDVIARTVRPYWGTVRRRGVARGPDLVGPL